MQNCLILGLSRRGHGGKGTVRNKDWGLHPTQREERQRGGQPAGSGRSQRWMERRMLVSGHPEDQYGVRESLGRS